MSNVSDGSSADYYKLPKDATELPKDATELQHLIAHKDMNAQLGEIFRASYRYGESSHSSKMRDINKIIYYANAELGRLTLLVESSVPKALDYADEVPF